MSNEIVHRSLEQGTYYEVLPKLVDLLLRKVHSHITWPIEVILPPIETLLSDEITYVHQGYIIFLWTNEYNEIEYLEEQMHELQYTKSWNSRGKFIIIIPDLGKESINSLALNISQTLWSDKSLRNMSNEGISTFTSFPYEKENCDGTINTVKRIHLWNDCKNDLKSNFQLFSNKIPRNFQECPLRVSTVGIPPYLITSHKIVDSKEIFTHVHGYSLEFIYILSELFNFKVIVNYQATQMTSEAYLKMFNHLFEDESDLGLGIIPNAARVSDLFDMSIPYMFESIKIMIPCPNQIPRTERVFGIFQISVWVVLIISVIVISLVQRQLEIFHEDVHCFKSISSSLENSWAVLLGLSIHQLPKTLILRQHFFLYVLYCMVISTIFQAFFTTYLVEPGYERQLKTIDEFIESRILYGQVQIFAKLLQAETAIQRYNKFTFSGIDCGDDYYSCIERIIAKKDFSALCTHSLAYYVANKMGFRDPNKVTCFIEEPLISGGNVVIFQKGNPLMLLVNEIYERIIEGGIVNRYMSMVNNEARLRSNYTENNNAYFVFSLSHISPIFAFLVIGYAISFIVVLGELFINMDWVKRFKQRAATLY
ncbi:hypothetical protein C0J52_28197 [Blattella germanica]|nr:hypothetical protein C0J52_28197 [Blattella germanica]